MGEVVGGVFRMWRRLGEVWCFGSMVWRWPFPRFLILYHCLVCFGISYCLVFISELRSGLAICLVPIFTIWYLVSQFVLVSFSSV